MLAPARAWAGALVAGNPYLLGVAGVGFTISFQTIAHEAVTHHLPGPAVCYPVVIDLGILALAVESRKLIARRRSDLAPRILTWALSAFTIYANAHGAPRRDWLAIGLHVVAPALWIAFLELTRRRLLAEIRDRNQDRIPLARWLSDWPWRTAGMWRRMVLHDIRSYPVAVRREQALLAARDIVKAWRRAGGEVPALLLHQLRTGDLPGSVAEAAQEPGASMSEPVSAWVTSELTRDKAVTADVRQRERDIERQSRGDAAAAPRQQHRGKAVQAPMTEAQKIEAVRRAMEKHVPPGQQAGWLAGAGGMGPLNRLVAGTADMSVRSVQRFKPGVARLVTPNGGRQA